MDFEGERGKSFNGGRASAPLRIRKLSIVLFFISFSIPLSVLGFPLAKALKSSIFRNFRVSYNTASFDLFLLS